MHHACCYPNRLTLGCPGQPKSACRKAFWDLQAVGLSIANVFAAPIWLFEGVFQWIPVCGQGFPNTNDLDQGGDQAKECVCLLPRPRSSWLGAGARAGEGMANPWRPHQPEALDGMMNVKPYHAAALPTLLIGLFTEGGPRYPWMGEGWQRPPPAPFLCHYWTKIAARKSNLNPSGRPEGRAIEMPVNPDQLWPAQGQNLQGPAGLNFPGLRAKLIQKPHSFSQAWSKRTGSCVKQYVPNCLPGRQATQSPEATRFPRLRKWMLDSPWLQMLELTPQPSLPSILTEFGHGADDACCKAKLNLAHSEVLLLEQMCW